MSNLYLNLRISSSEDNRGFSFFCVYKYLQQKKLMRQIDEFAFYFFFCFTCSLLQAQIKFPPDYPYNPPSLRFMSKVWHPNVYENGDLCISILHPPVDDPQSGELPSERWNPTQNVRQKWKREIFDFLSIGGSVDFFAY